tara:strand:- start:3504 stop:3803 length:300 start_codon:yes stop_codon:yes gene_type:complete
MNIIFGRKNLESLADKHTFLEVDTIHVNGEDIECFCIIDIEAISFTDFQNLEETKKLHQQMLGSFRAGDFKLARDLIDHLKSRLQGHMNSFYENLLSRM